jgi:hypothetical protein
MAKRTADDYSLEDLKREATANNVAGRSKMNKAQLFEAVERAVCAKRRENTEKYISKMVAGDLLAVEFEPGKALTGKFTKWTENSEFELEMKSGTVKQFKSSQILWVKTAGRWPRWVYEMFPGKGVNADGR